MGPRRPGAEIEGVRVMSVGVIMGVMVVMIVVVGVMVVVMIVVVMMVVVIVVVRVILPVMVLVQKSIMLIAAMRMGLDRGGATAANRTHLCSPYSISMATTRISVPAVGCRR